MAVSPGPRDNRTGWIAAISSGQPLAVVEIGVNVFVVLHRVLLGGLPSSTVVLASVMARTLDGSSQRSADVLPLASHRRHLQHEEARDMTINEVSATTAVSDHESAIAWYARLLDRSPDRRPMDGLAEWQITETGSMQVFADPARAGSSSITLGVDDLDDHVRPLTQRGIDLERQITSRGQRLGIIRDPDGNLVVFAEQLGSPTRRLPRRPMTERLSDEMAVLRSALDGARQHVLEIVDDLDDDQLRAAMLPSGWTPLELLRHLTLGDERYWFASIIGGDDLDWVPTGPRADWTVADDMAPPAVIAAYRDRIAASDEVLDHVEPGDAPRRRDPLWETWGVDFESVRTILLHMIVETSTHAGHLDAAVELIDGRQSLVMD